MSKLSKYIFEFVVIFVGITLSFLFDEWRESRSNRKRELQYYESLLIDIESDRKYLAQAVELSKSATIRIPDVIEWFENRAKDIDSSALASILLPSTPRSDHTFLITMESIRSSGEFRLISNEEVIRRYHGVISRNQYFRMTFDLESESAQSYREYIREAYPALIRDFFGSATYQSPDAAIIVRLQSDPRLFNQLGGLLYWNEFLIQQCMWLESEISRFEDLVRKEIEIGL